MQAISSPLYTLLAKAFLAFSYFPEADDLFRVCCIGKIHGPTTAILQKPQNPRKTSSQIGPSAPFRVLAKSRK